MLYQLSYAPVKALLRWFHQLYVPPLAALMNTNNPMSFRPFGPEPVRFAELCHQIGLRQSADLVINHPKVVDNFSLERR